MSNDSSEMSNSVVTCFVDEAGDGLLFGLNAELPALEPRRDKTKALKHAMMQELLTGRIRSVESGELRVEGGKRNTGLP